jgi:hypothetical protein
MDDPIRELYNIIGAYPLDREKAERAICRAAAEIRRKADTDLRADVDYIRAWCAQDQDALTSRQVADAVMHMCDDALAQLAEEEAGNGQA